MMEQNRPQEKSSEQGEDLSEESFLKDLYLFMKQRDTPIERIPHLGFKQIDLFLMYKTVKELGGYHQVTAQQLWKKVYNILGGNPRSTSAATCTRRHYEKLLLPFECHQTGYGDDIVIRTPRPHKRFHPNSYDFDHEYPRNAKRADFRHIPVFHPTTQNMFADHQRQIFPIPLNIAPYFPNSTTSLPSYFPLREPTLPHAAQNPQNLPRTPASLSLPTPAADPSCKDPLDKLRHLAVEYKSREEPLNLSRKENRFETLSDTPSSFGPPRKKPKFLNEASPLYSSRGPTTEEGADQTETADGTSAGERPGSARKGPSPVLADVIDLTSASSSNPVPRRASPPSVFLLNRRPNYPDMFPAKQRDLEWVKERSSSTPAPNFGLINRNNPIGHPLTDPNGSMEIQIPLKVLQELIQNGVLYSPSLTGPVSHPTKSEVPPEPKYHVRSHSETSEGSTMREEPADLSLKSPLRKPSESSQQDSGIKRSNGFTEESKPQSLMNTFQTSGPVKFSLDREITSKISILNVGQDRKPYSTTSRNQEIMSPRSPSYNEDTLLPLSLMSGTKSEKVMATAPIVAKDIPSSSPLLHVSSDHLKRLLASLPYRLERSHTF